MSMKAKERVGNILRIMPLIGNEWYLPPGLLLKTVTLMMDKILMS